MREQCTNSYDTLKEITLLNCAYEDRSKVKNLGAKWHKDWNMWYIDCCKDQSKFKQWILNDDQ